MNAMTPTETERNILEFMCDPDRPKQLLAQVKAAEAAEQKAAAARAEADAAMKAAADELTKARELQDINTKKSAALRDQAASLADLAEKMKAEKADDVARLTAWENSLKEYEANLKRRGAELDEIGAGQVRTERELRQQLSEAQAIIEKANRIAAAASD